MWWLFGVFGVGLVLWSIESARRTLYPRRRTIPPPQPLPSYTSHTIVTPDGSSLSVWLLGARSPRARVLVFHGYFANRQQVLD